MSFRRLQTFCSTGCSAVVLPGLVRSTEHSFQYGSRSKARAVAAHATNSAQSTQTFMFSILRVVPSAFACTVSSAIAAGNASECPSWPPPLFFHDITINIINTTSISSYTIAGTHDYMLCTAYLAITKIAGTHHLMLCTTYWAITKIAGTHV